jgi:hypothetical protein
MREIRFNVFYFNAERFSVGIGTERRGSSGLRRIKANANINGTITAK